MGFLTVKRTPVFGVVVFLFRWNRCFRKTRADISAYAQNMYQVPGTNDKNVKSQHMRAETSMGKKEHCESRAKISDAVTNT